MKKFSIIITVVILIIATYSVPTLMRDNEGESVSVSYYTHGDVTGKSTYMFDDIYLTNCDYSQAKKTERELVNVVGISYTLAGNYDKFCEVLNTYGIVVLSTEIVGNIHIIYGRSERCGQTRIVDGIAVNIQVAIRDDVITIGTPLIMGSY